MGIPPEITRVGPEDLEIVDASKGLLKGGFHHGWNLRGVVHVPPRPLINHGPHRCKWFVPELTFSKHGSH